MNLSLPLKIIATFLSLSFIASPMVLAKANDANNGVPAELDQIKALLTQVLGALTPPTPVGQNKTRLLFPFATNQSGFDTGINISNTGADSTGTIGIAGTATIYFFPGSGAAIAPVVTPSIPVGGHYTTLISTIAPGFTGYIEVVCEFPFGHGFGFFSDLGARNLAATIPALVLPFERTNTAAESLGQ